jgi:ATP-dependent helicase/nuclease subunit A
VPAKNFFVFSPKLSIIAETIPLMFKIYTSSAGSGKTYTLVKEYLKLALSEPENYRRILAITFTNKAAAEMKQRILSALKAFSEPHALTGASKTLFDDLKRETTLDEQRLKSVSGMLLQDILHNYSDFAVSTVDHFVHKIVRTFAHDLQLPWNFEVEVEDDQWLILAVDAVINRVGMDEDLTRALVEFSEKQTEDEKSWRVENDLKKLAACLLDEESIPYLKRLKNYSVVDIIGYARKIFQRKKSFETSIQEKALQTLALIHSHGLEAKDFYYGDAGIYNFFHKLTKDVSAENLQPNKHVLASIYENKWYKSGGNLLTQKKINALVPQLLSLYQSIERTKATHLNEYILCDLLSKRIYSLALLNEIDKAFEEIKKEKKIVHISELNKRINKIVSEESVPFIYERLGEKYRHFLMDEFQDTSVLQWHNLLPLVDNALAENNFIMVAGDGKQAIYRWRGGDVEQFDNLPDIIKSPDDGAMREREQSLRRHCQKETLRINYRSKKAIVDFNSELFRVLSELPDLHHKTIYSQHVQDVDPKNKGGYAVIEFLPYDRDKQNADKSKFQKIKSLIEECRADKYAYKDIAILTRNNGDASAIARFLIQEGIDVLSAESLLVGQSAEVQFIVSVLKILRDPRDLIARTEALYFLSDFKSPRNPSRLPLLFQSVAIPNSFQNFLDELGIDFKQTFYLNLSLYEMTESIIRTFRLNETPNPFIPHFLDAVLEYAGKFNNHLGGFLTWWENNAHRFSITIPQGVNAVTVSTIHKAKGLEFTVVIVQADWEMKKSRDTLWVQMEKDFAPECSVLPMEDQMEQTELAELFRAEKNKSFLDNLNLLYVAATRAKDRLYLLSARPKNEPEKMNRVSALLIHYCKIKNLWSSGQLLYEFGTKESKVSDKKEELSLYALKEFHSTDWRSKMVIQSHSEAADWGNLVHNALARIPSRKDKTRAVEDMMHEGIVNENDKLKLQDLLDGVLAMKEVQPFFEEDLITRTEAEIILSDHSVIRLDRIIFHSDRTTILDYKTGSAKKEDAEQLEKYEKALHEMGYLTVEKYLLYTEEKRLIKV